MLKDKKVVGAESYREAFERKFTNFCEKNILNLEFTLFPDHVEIEDFSGLMTKKISYEFDFSKDVRKAIYEIGRELKKFYPRFYDRQEKVYTNDDLKELLKKYRPEEIDLLEPEYVEVLAYTIFRVNNLHNEINVIDHNDGNRKKAYRFSIPVIEFIHTLYDDREVAYKIFKTRARCLGAI